MSRSRHPNCLASLSPEPPCWLLLMYPVRPRKFAMPRHPATKPPSGDDHTNLVTVFQESQVPFKAPVGQRVAIGYSSAVEHAQVLLYGSRRRSATGDAAILYTTTAERHGPFHPKRNFKHRCPPTCQCYRTQRAFFLLSSPSAKLALLYRSWSPVRP